VKDGAIEYRMEFAQKIPVALPCGPAIPPWQCIQKLEIGRLGEMMEAAPLLHPSTRDGKTNRMFIDVLSSKSRNFCHMLWHG
jgi:hypothetical protein